MTEQLANGDPREPTSPVRVGLIGMGRWGQTLYKVAAAREALAIVGVASSNLATASLVRSGCKTYSSWQSLLENAAALDAVIVATPPNYHREPTIAALRAGVPVLVEKPLALSFDDAKAIADVSNDTGVYVAVDHLHLFANGIVALRDALLAGDAVVTGIRTRAGAWGPFRPDVPVHWDWASHDVAIVLGLLGSVAPLSTDAASAAGVPRWVPETMSCQLEDHAGDGSGLAGRSAISCHIRTSTGDVPVTIDVSNVRDQRVREVVVETTRDTWTFREYPAPTLERSNGHGVLESVALGSEGPVGPMLDDFGAAVRERRTDRGSILLGVAVTEFLDAAEKVAHAA